MTYKQSILTLLLLPAFLTNCGCSSDSEKDTSNGSKPAAVNDVLEVEENSTSGTTNQIDVSKNDTVEDLDSATFSLISQANNGTVNEIDEGVFEYIPNENYTGTDSFDYKLTDDQGNSDEATVNVTVTPWVPSAEDFENIDPNYPSFVSVRNTTPENKKWVKLEAMSDEFDAWNSSKWFKSNWHYGVPVFMSTSNNNSGVSNGNLWIKATLNENNPDDRWFQTARIHSRAKTSYPMYTEARIKAAHISAYNTYWLNNGDINNRDEIDIIENNSKPSCNCQPDFPNQMNSQYFQADDSKTPQTIRNYGNFLRSDLAPTNPLRNVGWNEDYHTFGVWWQDSKHIQFYLNGQPAGSVVVGEDRNGNTYSEREFTRELEIIFDLWTNAADYLGGLPPKSDLNDNSINTMYIDWVRTWTLEDE
ncbi:Ig-like domain-containing protein [Pseudotamlana agarivorans]|uniref:Ig-like domain-containing protein n=1 Tax=Pseudotamlana agarivorans TaxID=481183 RepID=UPI0008333F1E|nr:Ig-like domain-containing protein [Tamlana agarivorans]